MVDWVLTTELQKRFGSDSIAGAQTNWADFYKGMSPGNPFAPKPTTPETPDRVLTPGGDFVAPSGSILTDLLTRVFGVSPLAGDVPTIDPETLAPTGETTSAADSFWGGFDFGSAVSRIAIIVLGFIFVAVGLSMFGAPVAREVVNSVAGR